MNKDVTPKNKPAAMPRQISRPVTIMVLCLLLIAGVITICLTVMAVTDRFDASGKNLAEVQGLSGPARVMSNSAASSVGVDRQGIADLGSPASRKFEPLILLMFGTMLLAIGAAIKIVMTRNLR